ncbi:hypothetical protein [Algibacter sp.]|uniref:hypothetical protein n=1 Tax=Algibacter sp. TaxID=1872428 RepID=UPI003C7083A7
MLFSFTVAFFLLFLSETESNIFNTSANSGHDIKIDHSFNTCATSNNSSFLELFNFDKKKNYPNYLESYLPLNKVLVENNSHYLKTCTFIDLSLTAFEKIFPFHTFL